MRTSVRITPARGVPAWWVTLLTVLGLVAMLLPVQVSAASATSGPGGLGDFRVSNYATGFTPNNYLWRGYAFRVARETTVTHLVGGGGPNCAAGFQGGIYEASWTGGSPGAGAPRLDALLRAVVWNPSRIHNNQEEVVELSEPLVLHPNRDYFMAQGRVSSGAGCHYAADSINVQDLLVGSPIIEQWYPNTDAAYQPSGEGTAADAVGRVATATTPIRVLMGFRYETDVEAASFDTAAETGLGDPLPVGPDRVRLRGRLADSGAPEGGTDETMLYFQFGTSPTLASSQLVQSGPVEGPVGDHTFEAEVGPLVPGQTYHYRSVAINEFGRSEGEIRSFVFHGPDPATVHVQPSTATAGAPVAGPPTVAVTDPYGAPVVGREVSVTLEGGSFADGSTTTVVTGADGRAVFDDLVVRQAGSGYRLRFGADNVLPLTSTTFTVQPGPVHVAGTTVESSPDRVAAGGEVTVVARLFDRYGNATADAGEHPLTLSTDLGSFPGGGSTIARAAMTEGPAGTFSTTLSLPRAGTATIGGAIGASFPATATVEVDARTPGAPTDLVAAHLDGGVELSWTAPDDDGGAAPGGYRVEVSDDGGDTWTTAIDDTASSSTTATVTGLTNGTGYRFRVSARNAAGTGGASETSASVTPRTVPGVPGVTGVTAGSRSVSLEVAAPAQDGGTPITGYRYSIDGGTTWRTLEGAPGTVTIGELRNGVAYDLTVRAVNAEGVGVATATQRLTPAPAPEPNPQPAPDQAIVVVGGTPIPATRTVENQRTVVLQAGDVQVRISGADRQGVPLRTDAAGRLVVREGGSVLVSGEGFAPGTDVDVWLFSEPTFLGQVAVGADGTFAASRPLPAGIAAGQHTAQLNGVDEDGSLLSASVALVVQQDRSLGSTAGVCDLPLASYPDFDDIARSTHRRNIRCMAAHDLAKGVGSGASYAPERSVTREQMATFITRFLERASGTTLPRRRTFGDLNGTVHDANIQKLATIGVVTGVGDGRSFDPDAPVTRAQMGSFVRRALSWLDDGDARNGSAPSAARRSRFVDYGFDGAHGDNVQAIATVGIVVGQRDGTYRPTEEVSRAQMASFVMRAYDWAHHELGVRR